jgi:hypothetical protein
MAAKKFDPTSNLNPGYHGQNVGRKPNRLKQFIGEHEISKADVVACINYVLDLSKNDLEKVFKSPDTPMLLVGLIAAAIRDAKNGNMANLLKMMELQHGKAEQSISFKGGLSLQNYDMPVSEEDAKKFIEKTASVLGSDLQNEANNLVPENE